MEVDIEEPVLVDGDLHGWGEHDGAVLAGALGPVEGDVGISEQLLGGPLGPVAMPMLARMVNGAPSGMANGAFSASRIRSATASAPAANDAPSTSTTNSSPPSRPTVSASRRIPVSRVATPASN